MDSSENNAGIHSRLVGWLAWAWSAAQRVFGRRLTPRRYFLLSIATGFGLLFSISALGVWSVFFDELFGYQILYRHQEEKTRELKDIETVFVGDSSMGNAIDAELFSELAGTKSANLALTGLYGYAGAYNMLKKMDGNPVRNVVVMSTLDTFARGPSFGGYLLTVSELAEIRELDGAERSNALAAFYNMILSSGNFKATIKSLLGLGKRRFEIEADYIAQGDPIDPREYPGLTPAEIIEDKPRFLLKLLEYCRVRNIRVIHAHGPIYEEVARASGGYIAEVNERLEETGVVNLPEITVIPLEKIGDSADHVAPAFKREYTRRYVELLSPHLRLSGADARSNAD
jgi:hypothetical protein